MRTDSTARPSTLPLSALTILTDKREKHPFLFPGIKTASAKLLTGDYTVPGLEEFVVVERKTPADFAYYLDGRRTQLESQIQRLLKIPHALVVIEGPAPDFDEDPWRSAGVTDLELLKQTLRRWRSRGLAIVHVPTHEHGATVTQEFLRDIATQYYNAYCPFCQHIDASLTAPPTAKRAA